MRVVITGVSSGIGAATAKQLKTEGVEVVGVDIAEPSVAIDSWIQADFTNPTSIAEAAKSAIGHFDALINSAGLPPREGLESKILQVNVFALIQFTEAMVPKLKKNAAIVNVASRAGAMWRENLAQVKALLSTDPADLDAFLDANKIDPTRAYNLSKEAVIVHTMASTQRRIAQGLRVNSVSPSAVETGILDDFVNAFGDKVAKGMAAAGRAGSPEEIAALLVFLAKPESNWIKGQDITIDGGMSAIFAAKDLEI